MNFFSSIRLSLLLLVSLAFTTSSAFTSSPRNVIKSITVATSQRWPVNTSILLLAGSKEDEMIPTTSIPLASFMMLGLPFLSAAFPFLLQTARSLPANSSEQLVVVTALFVGNRAYLYAMASTIVALAALRGANDAVELGKRVTDLTEELLYRPDLKNDVGAAKDESSNAVAQPKENETPKIIQQMRTSGLEESLDGVSSETQALLLPLLVSFLLATSIFFLPFFNGPDGTSEPMLLQVPSRVFEDYLKQYLPAVSKVWNIGILTLFCKTELRRLGNELEVLFHTAALEWGVAAGITAVAYFMPPLWPAQNFVNMALAVVVARMIQFNRFPAIVGALTLLTLYDVTSVLLIPAAGAAMMDTPVDSSLVSAAVGDSAMGSLAVQKLTSGTFQPGLLITKVDENNALGGALGLGDAVFPSILATFVRRFDTDNQEDDSMSLFSVSMGGYLLGCTACEFAPMISTSGLPALVFIIPSMLGLVLVAALISGEFEQLWNYSPQSGKV